MERIPYDRYVIAGINIWTHEIELRDESLLLFKIIVSSTVNTHFTRAPRLREYFTKGDDSQLYFRSIFSIWHKREKQ